MGHIKIRIILGVFKNGPLITVSLGVSELQEITGVWSKEHQSGGPRSKKEGIPKGGEP